MPDAILNWRRSGGYLVWLKADSAPTLTGDRPIAMLEPGVLQWSEFLDLLLLTPATVYHVMIIAYNTSGFSEPVRSAFKTDGAGAPTLRPSPAHSIRVRSIAGGIADVTWEYDELVGDAIADSFGVEITPLRDGGVIAVPDVPYSGRLGQVRVSGADGVYRCKVFSKRAGQYEPAVSGVEFELDGLGPTGMVYALAAVS